MENHELLERLDLIEFKQQLLFDDTSFDRFLFETNVTREQYKNILDLFDSLIHSLDGGETLISASYEASIYEIVPQCERDYHFAEFIAQTLHENGRYEEVFVALYGKVQKFQSYLNK